MQAFAQIAAVKEHRAKTPRTALFVGIGSGGVSASIGTYGAVHIPEIAYSVSAPIAVRIPGDFNHLLEEALKTLDVVLDKVLKEGLTETSFNTFESARVVLASPWYTAHTTFAIHSKDKPFTVTAPFMRALIDHTKREQHTQPEHGVKIEEAVTETSINGYPTTKPEGKQGIELELSLFESYADPAVLKAFEDRITKVFPRVKPRFHTFALVSFHALRNIFPDRDNVILLDVAGEVTDVMLVRDDALVSLASFPSGASSITRSTMNADGTPVLSPAEAASLMSIQTAVTPREAEEPAAKDGKKKKAAETASENSSTAANTAAGDTLAAARRWQSSFVESLAPLCVDCPLPPKVLLTAHGDAMQWFSSLVENADTSILGARRHSFSVTPVDAKALQNFVHLASPRAILNPFMALGLIYAHLTTP